MEEHALKLSIAAGKKPESKQQTLLDKRQRSGGHVDQEDLKSSKLIVKNLAFETTEGELRELFKAYGAVKKVRLPKKVNSKSHR